MVTRHARTLSAACSLALLAACGGDTPAPDTPPRNAAAPNEAPGDSDASAPSAAEQPPNAGEPAAGGSTGSVQADVSAGSGPSGSVEADVAAIADFNRRYLDAINTGDIDALAALTTDDHIMLAPSRPPLVGKAANIDAMTGAFERFDIDETWTPVETVVTGGWAYQRGTYTVSASPKAGGAATETAGSFLRIYRRQPDGEWRMIRDMFNSDDPPAQD